MGLGQGKKPHIRKYCNGWVCTYKDYIYYGWADSPQEAYKKLMEYIFIQYKIGETNKLSSPYFIQNTVFGKTKYVDDSGLFGLPIIWPF